MSKIRNLEQLENMLDEEIVWRKKELAQFKSMLSSKQASTGRQSGLIRVSIALLYAHWEGFIKNAATLYLNFIANKKLTYRSLSSNFIALAMKKKLNDAYQTSKATIYTEVSEFFISGLDERSNIPWNNAINTQSNLSSLILKEIICTLGLDYSFYETKSKLIDEKLLNVRNKIAHGEYILTTLSDYFDLHDEILGMMEYFRNQISNAAATEAYKR